MYGGTGWGCPLLGLNAKVMPRSCQGHMKVNLDEKYNKLPFYAFQLDLCVMLMRDA